MRNGWISGVLGLLLMTGLSVPSTVVPSAVDSSAGILSVGPSTMGPIGMATTVFGQDDDPFGDGETTTDAEDPFGDDGTAKPEEQGLNSDGTLGLSSDSTLNGVPALPTDPTLITEEEIRSASIGTQALLLPDQPDTPEAMIRVASLLAQIGSPEFGHRLLMRVAKLDLAEEALADLGETLPADTLLTVGTLDGLQPEGETLAQAIGSAYQNRLLTLTSDRIEPQIDTLIGDDSQLSPEELATLSDRRTEAMTALRRMGDHVVPYFLEKLGTEAIRNGTDSYAVKFRQLANDFMIELGESLPPVLAAAMESNEETLQLTALEVFAKIRPAGLSTTLTSSQSRGSDLFLAGLGSDSQKVREATLVAIRKTGFPFQDSPTTAANFARIAIGYSTADSSEMSDRIHPTEDVVSESAPRSSCWRWESDGAGGGKIVCAQMSATQQRLLWMVRYAQAAEQLEPNRLDYQGLRDIAVLQSVVQTQTELALTSGIPEGASEGTADQLLPFEQRITSAASVVEKDLLRRSTADLASTLVQAIQMRSVAAMGTLTWLLANRPDAAQALEGTNECGSAFVQALLCPDPRARFMAASAIMKMAPDRPWAQSHQLVETLDYFANSMGERRVVLVGFPDHEREQLRSFCTSAGYQSDFVGVGNELMRRANELFDVEVILIAVQVDRPTAEFLMSQIRRDARLSGIPVGILADEFVLPRAERIANRYPQTLALAIPADEATTKTQLDWLAQQGQETLTSAAEREVMAQRSLVFLSELSQRYTASQRDGSFAVDPGTAEATMVRMAMYPDYTEACLPFLSERGTTNCQRALLAIADSESYPESVRTQAIKGLERAIAFRTILLTRTEIQRQYDRFNGTGPNEPKTRELRGRILDVLEKPLRDRQSQE